MRSVRFLTLLLAALIGMGGISLAEARQHKPKAGHFNTKKPKQGKAPKQHKPGKFKAGKAPKYKAAKYKAPKQKKFKQPKNKI